MASLRFVPDDRAVELRDGKTILWGALRSGIPHAHACGGNARCSTCRVLVVDGLQHCSLRTPKEQKIAGRLGCGDEIRLACQTRITGPVTVRRLVLDPEDAELTDLRSRSGPRGVGEEKHVAVLFADIRGFTTFAESHLPYDVIHILRRLFRDTTAVITAHGGAVTGFMGDGFMAVFEPDARTSPELRAVCAGLGILEVADAARAWLVDLVGQSLDINVGIHGGEAVVGTIHDATHEVVTAIGDTVNVAARIEAANKVTGTRLLVSECVRDALGAGAALGRTFRVQLPGKAGEHELTEVLDCPRAATDDRSRRRSRRAR
jgi:adenylate cyclase